MDKQELIEELAKEMAFDCNAGMTLQKHYRLATIAVNMFWPLVEIAEGSCYCKGSSEPLCLPCRALSNLKGEVQ